MLAELTHFAGVVATPKPPAWRFSRLSFAFVRKARAADFVTADGDVQNHLLLTERDYTASELIEAQFSQSPRRRAQPGGGGAELEGELRNLQNHIASLMGAAIVAGQNTLGPRRSVMVTGEKTCSIAMTCRPI